MRGGEHIYQALLAQSHAHKVGPGSEVTSILVIWKRLIYETKGVVEFTPGFTLITLRVLPRVQQPHEDPLRLGSLNLWSPSGRYIIQLFPSL